MRHTIKPLLAALLALLALAALTSTAASAATCKKGTSEAEHKTLCVEGKQIGSSEKQVTTAVKLTLKAGTTAVLSVPSQEWSVSCARLSTSESPAIKSGGAGEVELQDLVLTFNECTVKLRSTELPQCSGAALGTSPLSSSIATPESVSLAGSTEAFGTLDVTGPCEINADYPIKGTQGCTLKQAEVEAVTKELVCESKSSHLSFGGGYGGPPKLQLEANLSLEGAYKGEKYSINK
jgi:hypothetical protein